MSTSIDRRMARAAERMHEAGQASVAARAAEESAAEAPAGSEEQRTARAASRVMRDISSYRIGQAGRLARGVAR